MILLNWIELISAYAAIGSFAWAGGWFFARERQSLRQRAAVLLVGVIAVSQLVALAFYNQMNLAGSLASFMLYALSIGLFWWTLRTARSERFALFFNEEVPGTLITAGPYRFVRHPFYSSYLLCWIAGVAATGQPLLLLGVAVALAVYWRAAGQEEARFLQSEYGAQYEAYIGRTGRLCPSLRRG